ncbi:MAG: potassium channel family protein [Chloroflexota bacterium]
MNEDAYSYYDNANAFRDKQRFGDAIECFEKSRDKFLEENNRTRAIDCVIQRTLCRVEEYLQDIELLWLINPPLEVYFKRMESDIGKIIGGSPINERLLHTSFFIAYRQLGNLYEKYGISSEAVKMFYLSVKYQQKLKLSWRDSNWLTYRLLWIMNFKYSYAEWIVLGIGAAIVAFFGLIYFSMNIFDSCGFIHFGNSFYLSAGVFSSLGFEDITPICWQRRLFLVVETVVGFITLGVLISVLTSKIIRR